MLHELRRLGTVTAVAQSLHFTHSSVSEQLRQLETEVGHPLLERVGRRLQLTQQGEIIADYAARMLGLADQALAAVADTTGEVTGTVRLASFPSVLATIAPKTLTLLAERHPELTVRIVHHDVHGSLKALHARDVDLVIGERYPDSQLPELGQGLDLAVMFEDPMVLLLPRTGALSPAPADFSGLSGSPWAMDPPGVIAGRWQRDFCRSHGFEPTVLVETPDPLLQLHLVGAGHAVALLYSLLTTPLLGGGQGAALAGPATPHAIHRRARGTPQPPGPARGPPGACRRRARPGTPVLSAGADRLPPGAERFVPTGNQAVPR